MACGAESPGAGANTRPADARHHLPRGGVRMLERADDVADHRFDGVGGHGAHGRRAEDAQPIGRGETDALRVVVQRDGRQVGDDIGRHGGGDRRQRARLERALGQRRRTADRGDAPGALRQIRADGVEVQQRLDRGKLHVVVAVEEQRRHRRGRVHAALLAEACSVAMRVRVLGFWRSASLRVGAAGLRRRGPRDREARQCQPGHRLSNHPCLPRRRALAKRPARAGEIARYESRGARPPVRACPPRPRRRRRCRLRGRDRSRSRRS